MKLIKAKNISDYKKEIAKEFKITEGKKEVFVIIDDNLKEYFHFFSEYNLLKIKALESNKTLAAIEKIYTWLLKKGAERNSVLIGVGGGVVTDITGYAAATYMRGIRCVLIPTTLLSQCDASIGGKNGVNFSRYKNIIGTIREPQLVIVCTEFLKTLPQRVFKEGVAEMLKTFLIANAQAYKKGVTFFSKYFSIPSESLSPQNNKRTENELESLIKLAQKIKLGIVGQDLYEKGRRKILNFGHTYAHAIESIFPNKVLHGEAVSIGIAMAINESVQRGYCSKKDGEKVIADLRKLSLPTSLAELEIESTRDESQSIAKLIAKAIKKDKKRVGEKINFIFFKKIGEVVCESVRICELKNL